jgi:hypothetical protein
MRVMSDTFCLAERRTLSDETPAIFGSITEALHICMYLDCLIYKQTISRWSVLRQRVVDGIWSVIGLIVLRCVA